MEDSRETHINNVHDLCRICATLHVTRKQQKHNSRSHLCSALSGDILLFYDLNIKNDIEDTHSQYLCAKCYSSIKTLKKRYNDSAVYNLNKDKWCPFVDGHKANTCKICTHRMGLTVSSIKRRESGCSSSMIRSATCPETHTRSHQNTPVTENIDLGLESTSCTLPGSIDAITDTSQPSTSFTTHSSHSLDTSETVLDHLHQLTSTLSDTNISILNQSQPLPNPLVEFSPFNILPVPVAKSIPTHSSNKQKITTDSSTSPMIKNYSTFSHSLSQSLQTPLTKEEEKLTTHLVRRKL